MASKLEAQLTAEHERQMRATKAAQTGQYFYMAGQMRAVPKELLRRCFSSEAMKAILDRKR